MRELEQSASDLERERDEARESASASRDAYEELEEAYRKERAKPERPDDWLSGLAWSRSRCLSCWSSAFWSRGDCSRRRACPDPIAKMQSSKLRLSHPPHLLRLQKCNRRRWGCPIGMEGAPESDCLLRCGNQRRSPPISATQSPRMQLAGPRVLLYTGSAPPPTPRFSCPGRGPVREPMK